MSDMKPIEIGDRKYEIKPGPKQVRAHHSSDRTISSHQGMFDYAGFGYGNLFIDDNGNRIWCTTSEASAVCAKFGMKMAYHDYLSGYTGVYLGD